ncbi:uncharacterized protein DFL_003777 [Arthrobotrys flagrans]|uniref:Uncharacterized protein n=1 Tax=Arthrobotrys flagrans TaxID=97331 RepID=A0A437A2T5_ARTFL|nr:hypothetical protein DFL_003777 [Arthrobotrys flagrans]
MSKVKSQEAITVTRGRQIVVIIPSIKTKEVGGSTTSTHVEGSGHSTHANGTTLAKASVSPETSVTQVVGSVAPTTFVISVRTSQVPPPVIIVTQVITITESPTGASSLMTVETSTIFTRAKENRPAGVPFPVGPLGTTEGQSPLETGGVHLPQEQFNGLAASPGVIAGSFAALVGVGLLICFGCWLRRKRHERRIKQSGAHPSSAPPNPPHPPLLPPINRYLHSPVWFGKKNKLSTNSTELWNLQPAPVGVATAGQSTATTPQSMVPRSPREGVIANISHTQLDHKRDILSTKGTTVDDRGYVGRHHHDDIEMSLDTENGAPVPNHDNSDIRMAVTQREVNQDQQGALNKSNPRKHKL